MIRQLLPGLLVLCACVAPAAQPTPPDRRIAVTIDDLPWQRIDRTAVAALPERHARLMASLRQAGVPVAGFVNEDKLEVGGEVQPARVAMLRDWLDAGFELGNHTHGHLDLHAVGLPAFEQAIVRGERTLRPLLAERDATPRWFRHPYLRAGRIPAEKAAVEAFLDVRGYRIAPVTVDNGEWVFAFAYANVLDGQPDTPARAATLGRLHRGYVPYMLAKLDYYERQSIALLGYALPQVLLLHANELNAAAYVDLVEGIRRRGYRFVTLDEALRDPAYAREDGYRGRYGPSWLHRWAMAEDKPKTFYAGEPEVPRWVLDLAGVESE